MLSVRNISAGYGRVAVLSDVTFDVSAGEVMSVVGANGAGKSTLVKVLSGILRPSRGQIDFEGEDITKLPAHEIVLRGIVHVPEGRRLFGDMTVFENLLLGSTHPSARRKRVGGLGAGLSLVPDPARARCASCAHAFGRRAADGRDRARADVLPKLLILDEPSLGLAPRIVTEILNVIRALNREGLTVLLIEQNVKHSLAIADRGIVMKPVACCSPIQRVRCLTTNIPAALISACE